MQKISEVKVTAVWQQLYGSTST